jgi:hypothetical protein
LGGNFSVWLKTLAFRDQRSKKGIKMNTPNPITNTDTLEQGNLDKIELLVECELSDLDRRKLISDLESQPQYWRVLAVAFLKQQSIPRTVKSASMEASLSPDRKNLWHPLARLHNGRPWQQFAYTATAESQ